MKGMEAVLLKAGFKNVIPSPTQMTINLTDKMQKYCESLLKEMNSVDTCLKNKVQYENGDNITELNSYFAELTVGYWIYKNDSINDYIGLYHYSRRLGISDEQINGIVKSNIKI